MLAFRSTCCSVFAALVVGGAVADRAHAAERSPFVPSGWGQEAAPAQPTNPLESRYQFRGVMTLEGQTFVTLLDTQTQRVVSLTVGEELDELQATDFHPEDGTLQLQSGGQTARLKLHEAKIVAMANPPPAPAPTPLQPGQQPGQQAGAPAASAGAPMSDEEARQRMQRVAEEIRRRREMRRQMLEAQQQGRAMPQQ